MAESTRRYNLRNTKKKPQGVLLNQWEVEYSKLISNEKIRIPLETVKTAIGSAFEDDMFEQWRITLKCPLSQQRIKVPARYADCTHIECFDLETFLRMKTQKNFMVCPICQKEIEKSLANLRIDKYIETVLSTMPNAMQVKLLPDGSFTEAYEDILIALNVIEDEEPFVQDHFSQTLNKSKIKQEVLEDDNDYIMLSDGEDEFMEEISIIEMKPIYLMPLNVDIKPIISSSSEQPHSREVQAISAKGASIPLRSDDHSDDVNTTSAAMTNFFQTALNIESAKLLMQQQKQAQSSPNVSSIWSQLTQASSIFNSSVTSKGATSAQVPQATSSANLGSNRSQNSGSNLASSPVHAGLNLSQMGQNPTQLAQIRDNKSIEDGFAEIRKRLEIQKQEFKQPLLLKLYMRSIQKLSQ